MTKEDIKDYAYASLITLAFAVGFFGTVVVCCGWMLQIFMK